jgi:hypothetical protein
MDPDMEKTIERAVEIERVKRYLATKNLRNTQTVLGRVTDLKCRSCSGFLQVVRFLFPPIPKPRHKNRKKRKALVARWMETNRVQTGVLNLMSLMTPPSYVCEKCGRRQGFYAAMARNLINVEPFPKAEWEVPMDIYKEISNERKRQDKQWGGCDHDDEHSINDFIAYIARHAGLAVDEKASVQRKNMVCVAALAVSVTEKLDRLP